MRKFQVLLLVFVCSLNSIGQTKNYATFEAEIANAGDGPIFISTNEQLIKKIEKNSQGIYKDTLNVEEGNYILFDGKQYVTLYLNNESDLKLKMDANNPDQTTVFSGKGSDVNNYITQLILFQKRYDFNGLFSLNDADFKKRMDEMKVNNLSTLNKYDLKPEMKSMFEKSHEMLYLKLQDYYANVQIQKSQNEVKNNLDNTQSPSFDYVNYTGEKTKLEDFKGKYVYIDIWATWCGPCRGEIPFLQKVEKEFEGKKIAFVSISIDEVKDTEKWKTFVKEKNLGGVQLMADKDWNSDFITSFGVRGIPRFILIGPDGKVVSANAPRPSNPELKNLLDGLLL